jgi:predicted dehydrogenase
MTVKKAKSGSKKSTGGKRLRIGVVGLGRIGWQHCINLHPHADFELAAVADREESRRQEAVGLFGCAAFESCDAMLSQAGLDAVVIASPTHLHKEMALAAFASGAHVFLEKPMAVTLKDAQAIARAAKRARRVLTVYQPHRAEAYFQELLQIIASKKLGEVYHVRRGMFNFVRRDDWQSLRKFGGGMLYNYGAHVMDQLFALTGSKLKRHFCDLRQVASLGDTEDVVKIVYETKNGVIGEADINQASVSTPYAMEVYGTLGTAFLKGDRWQLRSFSPKSLARKELNTALAAADRKYPRDSIEVMEEEVVIDKRKTVDVYADLAGAIRKNRAPFVKPEETLALMRFLEDCLTSGGLQQTRLP